jgi:CheY-like chemotaxis protein
MLDIVQGAKRSHKPITYCLRPKHVRLLEVLRLFFRSIEMGMLLMLTLVLSVGLDSTLLDTHSELLRSAGYTIESAWSVKVAVDRFLTGDFDLVLLCHSIPPRDRDRLTCLIRASGSRTPVVSIAGSLDQVDIFANATLEAVPEILLRGIREILNKATSERTFAPARSKK